VLTNNTGIKPAQTESSNTAANAEFSRNISIVSTTLVSAKPMAERSKLLVITAQRADITIKIKIARLMFISMRATSQ
jgi:hypothetical protein